MLLTMCWIKMYIKQRRHIGDMLHANKKVTYRSPHPMILLSLWCHWTLPYTIKPKFHLLRHVTSRHAIYPMHFGTVVPSRTTQHVTTRTTRRACRVVTQQVEFGHNSIRVVTSTSNFVDLYTESCITIRGIFYRFRKFAAHITRTISLQTINQFRNQFHNCTISRITTQSDTITNIKKSP